ncbi:MAG TPA: histidine kinase [Angustibacter sp.]|nr:histidine kinase [Angustibacter sp.]
MPSRAAVERFVAAVLIGALTALQLTALLLSQPTQATAAVDVVTAVASVTAVVALHRAPLPLAAVAAVLAAVSPAGTPVASYGLYRVSSERRYPTAAAVGVANVIAHLVRWWWRPLPGLSFGWWVVLVVIGSATVVGWGSYTRARRLLLESLRDRARRAEEQQAARVVEARRAERTRIAREMHDVLAHRLSLLAAYAGALEYRPDASPERLAEAAGVVRAGVHQALDELRDVITVLRDDGDPDRSEGTASLAPQPSLLDLGRLVDETRRAGTDVSVDVAVDVAEVPPTLGRTTYRVVQECLTNARRHAPGAPVDVRVDGQAGDELVVRVRNPLRTAPEPARGSGAGLVGVAERVALLGGRAEHGVVDDAFVVTAWLPWPA